VSVLLDTHVLLWWKGDPVRLSLRARRAVQGADSILVSPVTFWEVSTLARLGRIELDRDLYAWMADLAAEGIEVAALSAQAAAEAGSWPHETFPGDPADRLICATARELRVPVISKDARIHAFAETHGAIRVIW
jgi:PIN domain nuclease of toxin-antitoxin system